MEIHVQDWPRAYGTPLATATFRQQLSDFCVDEDLRFEPSGEGAHHLLLIEKRNINTDIVCHKLRRFAEVHPTDVGYAGKKDRFAIARQWFSVQLPLLKEIDWSEFNDDEVTVLKATRHDKKLRIGAVKQNHFAITLRDLNFSQDYDKQALEQRLEQIQEHGFANYFGEQRFGHNGDNLTRGADLLLANKRLKNRNLQGLLFSAVRSFLFNQVLAKRIEANKFTELLDGDYVQLDGSESGFTVQDMAQELPRFVAKDIHPTAPMPGRGRSQLLAKAAEFETAVLEPYHELIAALERKGLNGERRAIRVFPQNVILQWHNDNTLELAFSLPKGAFATSLLRELFELKSYKADSSQPEKSNKESYENTTE